MEETLKVMVMRKASFPLVVQWLLKWEWTVVSFLKTY